MEQNELNNSINSSPKNKQSNQAQESKAINYNLTLSKFTELKSHFDVIRKLAYLPNLNSLVSVSEDCLIKIWSLNNLNFSNPNSDIEPYLIFRGHTGPLYALASSPDNQNLIYTAGIEGIINIWKVYKPDEVNQMGDTDLISNCKIGIYEKSNEVVWDICPHPKQNFLLSLNADGLIYAWETPVPDDYMRGYIDIESDKWFKSSKSRYSSSMS